MTDQGVDKGLFEWAVGTIVGLLVGFVGWAYRVASMKADNKDIKAVRDELISALEDHMLDDKEQFAKSEERDAHTQGMIEDARKERRDEVRYLHERLSAVETGLRSEMNQGFSSLRDAILKKG